MLLYLTGSLSKNLLWFANAQAHFTLMKFNSYIKGSERQDDTNDHFVIVTLIHVETNYPKSLNSWLTMVLYLIICVWFVLQVCGGIYFRSNISSSKCESSPWEGHKVTCCESGPLVSIRVLLVTIY